MPIASPETPVFTPGPLQRLLTGRLFYVLLLLAVAGLYAFALYLQYARDLEPCPLCMAQRVAMIAMAVAAILGLLLPSMVGINGEIHRSHSNLSWLQVFATVLAFLFAVAGAALAARQLWLQSLPPELVPACGPGFDYMLEVFPMSEVISMMLHGSGECAEVQWQFLGLSIPGWTFIAFSLFAIAFLARFIALVLLKNSLGRLQAQVTTGQPSSSLRNRH
ncbi:disulfide bond formation protein B [Allohahella marinimesophila]|uniref:Disulfide bond formation protein B n=1 Tax=Allohahella marinimesophila TaxID=1054972 RepID=A0ABP7PB08_9GAMM